MNPRPNNNVFFEKLLEECSCLGCVATVVQFLLSFFFGQYHQKQPRAEVCSGHLTLVANGIQYYNKHRVGCKNIGEFFFEKHTPS